MRRGLLSVIALCLVIIAVGGISIFYNGGQAGNQSSQTTNNQAIDKQDKTAEAKTSIVLYFSDRQAGTLVPERREVPRTMILNKAEETVINELLKGPISKELLQTIPKGTKLLSAKREGDTVIIDLSKEFVDNHPGGSAGETMTLYSIVNSLTELKDVEKVNFLIDGKTRNEFKGHYQLNIPFERNETIIKK